MVVETKIAATEGDLFALGPDPTDALTAPAPTAISARQGPEADSTVGGQIGEFTLLRELGRGAFATVFLAHQTSLNRQVALKVSGRRGLGEGQALAALDHDNIVKVFSEFMDPRSGRHVLCLQYISGPTLHQVIQHVHAGGGHPRSGQTLLAAIDSLAPAEVGLDPASLGERQGLACRDLPRAVCWLGAKLADALAYAHARGVLHCDIKPANILFNRYGRPLLADFNISVDRRVDGGKSTVGGTVHYMSPEHLAQFAHLPGAARVDERADIYSLAVVLYELLTGRLPYPEPGDAPLVDEVKVALQERSDPTAFLDKGAGIPPVLWRVLRRCLEPDPARRYASAAELARALANAGELLTVEDTLRAREDDGGRATRRARAGLLARASRYPIRYLVLLTLLPHFLGSIVNITYNATQVRLTPDQETAFLLTSVGYNAVIYPVCLLAMYLTVQPVYRGWAWFLRTQGYPPDGVLALRRRVLGLSDRAVAFGLLGWMPGALIFPVCIDLLAGPLPWEEYTHFAVSFVLSGLIATVYSYFGVQAVALRVMYPHLGDADSHEPGVRRAELSRAGQLLPIFLFLAALVPLAGAVLLVAVSGDALSLSFRLLVVGLIVLGMLGVGVAVLVSQRLARLLHLLGGVQQPE